MTNSHNRLPANLDPSYFEAPSSETLGTLEDSLLSLRNIAESMVTDGVTDYFFKYGFRNGSKLAFNDSEGPVDSEDPRPEPVTPKRRVVLETVSGVIFEYHEGTSDGRNILVIQRLGLDVTRELLPTETLEAKITGLNSEEPESINVTFVGGVDHPLRQKVALFTEARAQGTDVLTEAKVVEFSQEINDAVNSGVDDSRQIDLTNFAIW